MIGFITTPETAAAVLAGIRQAQINNGRDPYWTTGAEPIHTGDNAGEMFIPAGDEVLDTPLRNGLTPRDFPEFDQLVALLGGLDSRVEINPEILIDPDASTEPDPQISLSTHCSQQIDDLLDDSMSMGVNGKIFTSQDHASSTYVRNPDLWCGDLDITCASPWNSSGSHKRAGTLVTPRHVIGAAHYEYSVGAVVRFVEKDGTVHDRTVAGKARHPDYSPHIPDLTIYTLDSDLPPTIKPCAVMPSDYISYLVNEQVKTACLGLDQEEKALIIDWNSGGRMRTPTDPNRLIFHENKISGDSGNPAFIIVDGELVLMTVWTYGGAGGGTAVADYISGINTMIATADTQAGVSTNYTVTEADFSTFPKV